MTESVQSIIRLCGHRNCTNVTRHTAALFVIDLMASESGCMQWVGEDMGRVVLALMSGQAHPPTRTVAAAVVAVLDSMNPPDRPDLPQRLLVKCTEWLDRCEWGLGVMEGIMTIISHTSALAVKEGRGEVVGSLGVKLACEITELCERGDVSGQLPVKLEAWRVLMETGVCMEATRIVIEKCIHPATPKHATLCIVKGLKSLTSSATPADHARVFALAIPHLLALLLDLVRSPGTSSATPPHPTTLLTAGDASLLFACSRRGRDADTNHICHRTPASSLAGGIEHPVLSWAPPSSLCIPYPTRWGRRQGRDRAGSHAHRIHTFK